MEVNGWHTIFVCGRKQCLPCKRQKCNDAYARPRSHGEAGIAPGIFGLGVESGEETGNMHPEDSSRGYVLVAPEYPRIARAMILAQFVTLSA